MVIFVVILNLGLAMACWRVALQILVIREAVRDFRQTVLQAEENCRAGLTIAPEQILKVQWGSQQLRQQQRQWSRQSLGVRRTWQLLIWGQRLLHWYSR